MHGAILAIDVGSTRLKAALVAPDGALLHTFAGDSPLHAAAPQASDVLQAVLAASDAVCAGVPPAALAITGATRTHVLTSGEGQALDAIVKLDDARGASFEVDLQRAYGEPERRGLGAFHPLARLVDLEKTQPILYAHTRWQLELKDWLNLQLTGVAAIDAVTEGRDQPRHVSFETVLQRLALRPELCPSSLEPGRIIGTVRETADARHLPAPWLVGVPVVQCGFDAWCASLGMGCVRERHVYNVSGTTEVFGSFSRDDRPMSGIGSLRWTPELFHLGGPCLTGLGTLAWFGRSFLDDADPQGVLDCAAAAGDDTPLCLPFVSGERMPFWRGDLSAQFLGVRSTHGKPEFARALVDGLFAFQRHLVGLLCADAQTLHLSGGAISLRGWQELKAAMFGRPVDVCEAAEPSLVGCAMAAFCAIGRQPSLAAAQDAMAPTYRVIGPDTAVVARLRDTEQKLRPYFLEMSAS
ncbi:MAG: FGGY-family carbohydrate kinase [Variovorax sp.]